MCRVNMAIIFVSIVLSGCAQPVVWLKPGFTQADFNRDKAQCDYETSGATQNVDYGYRTVFGQALDQALRKQGLMHKCFIARGYTAQSPTK